MNRCLECGMYIEEGSFCSDECFAIWDEEFELPPSQPVVLPEIDYESIPF